MISCIDAILLNDGRELIMTNASKNIISMADNFCFICEKMKLN